MKIRLLAALLAVLTVLPVFAGCNNEEKSPDTTTAETAADTTVATTDPNEPEDLLPNATPYGNAGIESALNIANDYYSPSGFVRAEAGKGDAAFVWGVASYIEALAEAYRICPENKTIADTYVKVLDKALPKYKVTANIKAPTGTYKVTYYNASSGGKGDYYYDDDAWICIQFLNAYELLKDEKYLQMAEDTLEFLWTGWDDQLGGGIYWDKTYGSKNTCDNGPIAISFLWAYQITKKEEYLEKGKQIYDWCNEKLRNNNNLYIDNIGLDGKQNNWQAAYNQGVMIYAGAQLYEITGDENYYKLTKETVNAANQMMFSGAGKNTKMAGNPIYKSWCIGWLERGFIKFYTVDPDKNDKPMTNLANVLTRVIEAKGKTTWFKNTDWFKNLSKTDQKKAEKVLAKYYDPYFLSGDWGGESRTDVLQPSGMTTVFCLTHYFLTSVKDAKS